MTFDFPKCLWARLRLLDLQSNDLTIYNREICRATCQQFFDQLGSSKADWPMASDPNACADSFGLGALPADCPDFTIASFRGAARPMATDPNICANSLGLRGA